MKKTLVILLITILSSCGSSKLDGFILVEPTTGRRYLMEYRVGDLYFINEEVSKVVGSDTIKVFNRLK